MIGPIYLGEDPAEVAEFVALRLASIAVRCARDEGLCRIALSGGSTAVTLFDVLADRPFRDHMPWGQIILFQVDDRVVEPDSSGSNAKAVRERLLEPLGDRSPVFHPMVRDPSDASAARSYERLIKEIGPIDVAVMGMGEDGHTASLFPGFESEWTETKSRVLFTSGPAPYPRRITLSPVTLAKTGRLLFMVTGKTKGPALANPDTVATRVSSAAQKAEWWLDAAAYASMQSCVRTDAPA